MPVNKLDCGLKINGRPRACSKGSFYSPTGPFNEPLPKLINSLRGFVVAFSGLIGVYQNAAPRRYLIN